MLRSVASMSTLPFDIDRYDVIRSPLSDVTSYSLNKRKTVANDERPCSPAGRANSMWEPYEMDFKPVFIAVIVLLNFKFWMWFLLSLVSNN